MQWIERHGQHQLIGDSGRVLAHVVPDGHQWALVLYGQMMWHVVRGQAASLAQSQRFAMRWHRARR